MGIVYASGQLPFITKKNQSFFVRLTKLIKLLGIWNMQGTGKLFLRPPDNLKLYIMNYLAHAFLSFNRPGILVGNMISDFVKGKKKYEYPDEILAGINLHRAIDDFTDLHPVTKSARQIFQPDYGLYSGAFMDIAYDYFIANDKELFEPRSLETFSQEVYEILESYSSVFPPKFKQVFPSMKKYNWLLNYQYTTGIERSFEGLVYRATFISDSSPAFTQFLLNKEKLETAYKLFFPELIHFTKDRIENNPM